MNTLVRDLIVIIGYISQYFTLQSMTLTLYSLQTWIVSVVETIRDLINKAKIL